MTTTARYGTWTSPITAQLLVADSVALRYPVRDGDDLYWSERRPLEAGRIVVVRRDGAGNVSDALPEGFSARSLVHEYGGRCVAVHEGVIFFSNFADQRLYRLEAGGDPVAITPEPPTARAWRYRDPVVTSDGAHLVAVRERHGDDVENDLVVLPTDGSGDAQVIASGHDFYSSPTISPGGRRLAWVAWDHPNMPWDSTLLYEAEVDDELRVLSTRLVAGESPQSLQQPQYGAGGTLHFISDRTGWWNLYAEEPDGFRALAPRDQEFAGPEWQSISSYVVRDDGSIICTWNVGSVYHLGLLSVDGALVEIATPYSDFEEIVGTSGPVALVAGSPSAPPSIVEIDPSGAITLVRVAMPALVDPSNVSLAQDIEFPTGDGVTAHALYYPPMNPDFVAPVDTYPPLIVVSHGGPTGHDVAVLDYQIQFWTSRGFAVVDVNYGGSTGYGRDYRNRLKGRWGVVDLDDCVNAATFLASTGRADPEALLIRGESAGGYTTLCALTFRDDFAAGASYYGIGDLKALARDTHKFESRYLDGLIGPWPEAEAVYEERSPVFHTELMRTPVILFQGLEDEVVPPAQAEEMARALRARGVPFAYLSFAGEQHGFRRAETIVTAIEAELAFYGRILGFTPAGDPVPLVIENEERLTPA